MLSKIVDSVVQDCNEEKEDEIAEIKAQYEEKTSRLADLQRTMENLSESKPVEEKAKDASREEIIKEILPYFDKKESELNEILKSHGKKAKELKGLKTSEKVFLILTEKNLFDNEK